MGALYATNAGALGRSCVPREFRPRWTTGPRNAHCRSTTALRPSPAKDRNPALGGEDRAGRKTVAGSDGSAIQQANGNPNRNRLIAG